MITNLEPYVTLMKVMFVCSGNAFRSPVAEALLKKSKAGCGRELNACMYAYPHSKHAIFIILEPSIMELNVDAGSTVGSYSLQKKMCSNTSDRLSKNQLTNNRICMHASGTSTGRISWFPYVEE